MLSNPLSVALDYMGNVYIADTANHRIQLFLAGQSNGTTIAGVTGSAGNGPNQLNGPYWAILDDQLNLYVADNSNNRVQRFQRFWKIEAMQTYTNTFCSHPSHILAILFPIDHQ